MGFLSRLDEDEEGGSKAQKLAENAARREELRKDKAELWNLTPKSS